MVYATGTHLAEPMQKFMKTFTLCDWKGNSEIPCGYDSIYIPNPTRYQAFRNETFHF